MDSYRKRVMVRGEQVMLDIVDTAGQEDYVAVRDHYLRNADGYLCVFSLAEPESLQDIIDLRYTVPLTWTLSSTWAGIARTLCYRKDDARCADKSKRTATPPPKIT